MSRRRGSLLGGVVVVIVAAGVALGVEGDASESGLVADAPLRTCDSRQLLGRDPGPATDADLTIGPGYFDNLAISVPLAAADFRTGQRTVLEVAFALPAETAAVLEVPERHRAQLGLAYAQPAPNADADMTVANGGAAVAFGPCGASTAEWTMWSGGFLVGAGAGCAEIELVEVGSGRRHDARIPFTAGC